MAYDSEDRVYNRDRDGSIYTGQYVKTNISWRTLFTNITVAGVSSWVKVAGECLYYTDNATTFTTTTMTRFDPLYSDEGFKKSVVAEVNQRQLYDSMAYPLAQGIEHIFGNIKQGVIKVKTDVETINPQMLGELFGLDVNSIIDNYTFTFIPNTDFQYNYNLVLTSVTTDYATGKTEATFFIRGDE
jgi:hypothetical protein